jgi:hypothetical protein
MFERESVVVAVGFSNSATGSIITSGESSSLSPQEASVNVVRRINANLSRFIPMLDFVF